MDLSAFVDELPAAYDGDFYGTLPSDRFDAVVASVDGMSTAHSLTLLNEAVRHLGPDEYYLEVGSYRGRSLIGAMLGHDHDRFVAIENFREFGVPVDEAEHLVLQTLLEWGVRYRVRFLRGEAFRMLPRGVLPGPVGVYFYDGAHSRLAQYLGLALAEPWLADNALVIVDDSSWPQVASSTRSYMDAHPGYELLFDFRAKEDFDPLWCNGVKVFAWRRPQVWSPPQGSDVLWRKMMHLYVHEPAFHLAWQVVPRYPRVLAALKRTYHHGGSSVPTR